MIVQALGFQNLYSQADALPPHIALHHSSASQSNQPPPEQRQSTHAHPPCNTEELCPARSAKYERISLLKVGARQWDKSNTGDDWQNKRQPPEQQADEARFRLQNVVTRPSSRREGESAPPPIHTVQLAVATEATPLSAVDTEARPSCIGAGQQQPTRSLPCLLPFTPFCLLATTYGMPGLPPVKVSIPEFQRRLASISTEGTWRLIVAEARPLAIVAMQQQRT